MNCALCFEYQACQEVSGKILRFESSDDELAREEARGEQRLSVPKASKQNSNINDY